jgi:hypothetical protein
MMMASFLLTYYGNLAPEDEAESSRAKLAWGKWLTELEETLVDTGTTMGATRTIDSAGAVSDGSAHVITGYSIINAADLDDAVEVAKGCPVRSIGGTVEVRPISTFVSRR